MKLNLLKKLLTLSPVVISPILVTACGNSDDDTGNFYVKAYQSELNTVWATQNAAINTAANSPNHQYDLKKQVLDETLTKVKATGAAAFKKEFPDLDSYKADYFDDIKVSFSIPQDDAGNVKVAGNNLLVYPGSIMDGEKTEKQINYNLSLKEKSSKDISGSLKFDLGSNFISYSTKDTGDQKLPSDSIVASFGNQNMSTILLGTQDAGLSVGNQQANGGYAFTNYDIDGTGSQKLANNKVLGVSGNKDMSEILVGEYGGGLDVGKRAKASDPYAFTNYDTSKGLASNDIFSVYDNGDLSTILVAEDGGGLDVGTRAKASDAYTFSNYKIGSGLSSDDVFSTYGDNDMKTILVATDSGLEVGTRDKASDRYSFTNYNTSSAGKKKLSSNNIYDVYGTVDMSEILLATTDAGVDLGTRQSDGSYNFINYSTTSPGNKKLSADQVSFVAGNANMSEILVGEDGGGLDVGKKVSADSSYEFTNYTNIPKGILSSNKIVSGYSNSDLSGILLGTFDGGIDISSNLWFS